MRGIKCPAQLSGGAAAYAALANRPWLVGKAGFEPATSASRTLRANQAALLPGAFDCTRRNRHRDGLGEGGVVVIRPAVEQRFDGPAQANRVERLQDPALDTGAAGEKDVGPPVQQRQHRSVLEPAGAL